MAPGRAVDRYFLSIFFFIARSLLASICIGAKSIAASIVGSRKKEEEDEEEDEDEDEEEEEEKEEEEEEEDRGWQRPRRRAKWSGRNR